MRAIRVRRFGGPEELRVEEVEMPAPGEGEVLIEVRAAGLNYAELLQREGRYPGAPPFPFTPGFEAAGVVAAVGPGVSRVRPGARVVAMLPGQGAFAEYAIAAEQLTIPIPDSLPFEAAAALPVQAPTALLCLRVAGRLGEGESVFIPAAAGGVGSFLVQLARRLGAGTIIAGASTEEKRATARRLGADLAIDYTRPDWPDRVRAATGGRGADVVFDMSGGVVGEQSLKALAPQGRLVLFGADSPHATRFGHEQVAQIVHQNQAVVGFNLPALPPDLHASALAEVLGLIGAGQIEVLVGQTFPLAEVAGAHRAMAERRTSGKVVILPRRPERG